jgi:transposase
MDVPACPGCRERDQRIVALEQQVAALQAAVHELRDQLGRNASNSSLPPSANPPGAPQPVAKKPTGRKPGGPPGHPPPLRLRLPPERVNRVVPYVPSQCDRCQAPLPPEPGPDDPEPTWHQVAELPPRAAPVTEYQGHARTCPCCGHLTRAAIPTDIRAESIGPRLAAVMAYLSGSQRLSKRGVEESVEAVFDVPVSLGTVARLAEQTSAALAPAHAEAVQAVRHAEVKHADETGWKQAGARRWLWVAATACVAAFLVHARRGAQALRALLGESIVGVVCSDRWGAYGGLPLAQRQVCWAHLKRDFQKCVDRGGASAAVGAAGLAIVAEVFAAWHLFRGGGLGRAALQDRLGPLARALREVLRLGQRCADSKVAPFCANVDALGPALWTFAAQEGVEPTNNHAERVLRRAVWWRKGSFGSHSEGGCRFVERLLTVVQTLRLQGRSVLEYLHQAIIAHRSGLPAPKLLPTG